ncbi:MAG: hypothetical protein AAFY17_01165, partial [Cyanobacteria bacterium J06642_11]
YFSVQRWLRQRQAWKWWHQHQTDRLHEQAESIRDDLLQQTFAFRRFLEASLDSQPKDEQTEEWLQRFQTLYKSLEQLSDQLSPPFVADSLPLALQCLVQAWQQSQPGLSVQLKVPNGWPDQATKNNPIIMSIFTGLVESLFPNDQPYELHITLDHEDKQYTLTFEQTQMAATSVVNTVEINHLKEIFRSLTAGRLDINVHSEGVRGQLCWSEL